MYHLHKLEITGKYRSATGGKDIDLNGFDVEVLKDSRLRFWMVNNRPAVDEAGNFLDASKVGANATIEVFEHEQGSGTLEFIKTIWSEAVPSPNNAAATGNGSVFVTNDHDDRAGFVSTLTFSSYNLTLTVPRNSNAPRRRHTSALPPFKRQLHHFSVHRTQIPPRHRQALEPSQRTLYSQHSERLRFLPPDLVLTPLS